MFWFFWWDTFSKLIYCWSSFIAGVIYCWSCVVFHVPLVSYFIGAYFTDKAGRFILHTYPLSYSDHHYFWCWYINHPNVDITQKCNVLKYKLYLFVYSIIKYHSLAGNKINNNSFFLFNKSFPKLICEFHTVSVTIVEVRFWKGLVPTEFITSSFCSNMFSKRT